MCHPVANHINENLPAKFDSNYSRYTIKITENASVHTLLHIFSYPSTMLFYNYIYILKTTNCNLLD